MKILNSKMFKVQEEIEVITKDKTNPHFKSSYFDINTLLGNLKPILNKHGLLVSQPIVSYESKTFLRTTVCDVESGETKDFDFEMVNDPNPQKMGSTISYYRRYALQSLFLLEAKDDDGNTAAGHIQPFYEPVPRPVAKPAPTPSQSTSASLEVQSPKPMGSLKKCPLCGKQHTGQYQRCYECYSAKRVVPTNN